MGRDLPNRSTRGKRIQRALEEEDDADNEFWNQEFFAEEQEDLEYEASDEGEDVVDSDFDEPVCGSAVLLWRRAALAKS